MRTWSIQTRVDTQWLTAYNGPDLSLAAACLLVGIEEADEVLVLMNGELIYQISGEKKDQNREAADNLIWAMRYSYSKIKKPARSVAKTEPVSEKKPAEKPDSTYSYVAPHLKKKP